LKAVGCDVLNEKIEKYYNNYKSKLLDHASDNAMTAFQEKLNSIGQSEIVLSRLNTCEQNELYFNFISSCKKVCMNLIILIHS
jgi:hypothetical protein